LTIVLLAWEKASFQGPRYKSDRTFH